MADINLHGKTAPIKMKTPTGSIGNVVTHGKTAAIRTRSTSVKKSH